MNKLYVYFENILLGEVWLDEKSRFCFKYDKDYLKLDKAFPLSIQLPLREEVYLDDFSRSFFSNLLPEGDIRTYLARMLQISERNDMLLLDAIGGECAGAISIVNKNYKYNGKFSYKKLDESRLKEMLKTDKKIPLLAHNTDLRLSLAGAQDKIPVYFDGESVYLTKNNSPSSHILKPDNKYFPNLVINEYFCMSLAKFLKLPVSDVQIIRTEDKAGLLIKRYDRKQNDLDKLYRIHQEDFCQALGYLSSYKYENEGGPKLIDCFNLIKKYSFQPLLDKNNLINWVIFNYIIGNADAHAKNISILYELHKPCLAPFYDLNSTLVYPELMKKLAMKIGGENRFDFIQKRHWERFADEIEVKKTFILERLKNVSEKIQIAIPILKQEIFKGNPKSEIVSNIISIIDRHLKRIANL
ncbi:MAG: type II toxin-antitoxin system HipA family toxin [Pseudomonadota bacterium]